MRTATDADAQTKRTKRKNSNEKNNIYNSILVLREYKENSDSKNEKQAHCSSFALLLRFHFVCVVYDVLGNSIMSMILFHIYIILLLLLLKHRYNVNHTLTPI